MSGNLIVSCLTCYFIEEMFRYELSESFTTLFSLSFKTSFYQINFLKKIAVLCFLRGFQENHDDLCCWKPSSDW